MKHPQFMVMACDCQSPRCDRIIFLIIRPQIRTLKEDDELLCPFVAFPVEHLQSLIDELRSLAGEKGVTII